MGFTSRGWKYIPMISLMKTTAYVPSEQIINAYVKCKYKAFLYAGERTGLKSDYELLQEELDSHFIKTFKETYSEDGQDFRAVTVNDNGLIVPISGFYTKKKEFFIFTPVVFSRSTQIAKDVRLQLALKSVLASNSESVDLSEHGLIVHGSEFKRTKVTMSDLKKSAAKKFDDLKVVILEKTEPKLALNKHCKVCEFQNFCREEAIKKDDLSLLSLGEKEVAGLNKRGLFTITQLSHTFRPKRRFKHVEPKKRPRQPALHALAIREKKIHVYSPKEMPLASTQIFLDVESNAEKDFYYLIGMVIRNDQGSKKYSFWADEKTDAVNIFKEFLSVCESIKEFSLIHYGSFETKFLKAMANKVEMEDSPIVQKLLTNSINLLETIYTSIYFPTYSNDLKTIANSLGFKWSDGDASGLQSIVWRTSWENTGDPTLKEKLLTYNIEDCLALEMLVSVVRNVLNYKTVALSAGEVAVVRAEDIQETYPKGYNWGGQELVLPEMEFINKCAYFDYQRDTVFIRTNKKQYQVVPKQKSRLAKLNQINKKVEISIDECPRCGPEGAVRRKGRAQRTQFDLKFFGGGIKKWIVKYTTSVCFCKTCQRIFYPKEYPGEQSRYGSKFGHNFMSWVLYQHIVNGSSMSKIQDDLRELFRIEVGLDTLQKFKVIGRKYYELTYQQILSKIVSGNVIVADEAQVTLRMHSAYIWVFATSQEVIFYYRDTRESSFLDDFLQDFKGVLVTDFFSGYDSLPCPQQKCLIHLMRDLNEDLTANPFDEEFKQMTRTFTQLLRTIVGTVDKKGLKKRFLAKHKKDVNQFFRNVVEQDYKSLPAQKYQKRFTKNKDKLFTFLDYDGVPWNSNAAEYAIKHLANLRQTGLAKFRKDRINDYLQILSIYQTCRYRKISFLEFLLSKEKDLA